MRPDSISLDYLFQMFKDNIDPKFDGKCGKCKKRVIRLLESEIKELGDVLTHTLYSVIDKLFR